VGVVGAGIIGLATARRLLSVRPGLKITVLEKENDVARHQTGHNSGVVHTGIYYTPGSLKARLCTSGRRMLKDYCMTRNVPYEECGKLLIAVKENEEPRLRALYERATINEVPGLRLVGPEEISEIEPHATGRLALHSPAAAIVDFARVARSMAHEVLELGGEISTSSEVTGIRSSGSAVEVDTPGRAFRFDHLIVCAGLHADRMAELAGDGPDPQIVPFRGDFMTLKPERSHLVRGLIYPVPDPRFPFLGVHLTRTTTGRVLVGPSAILAFAREGYKLTKVDLRDLRQTLGWVGFRKLARRHWKTGAGELYRAINRRAFVRQARRYVPALRFRDVEPAASGVRAQAIDREGHLVDDFRLSHGDRLINVRNAPSPAATSSLAIAEVIADSVMERLNAALR
jgi:(S)-2-hydroxyglutarate dehydrogenase